MSNQEPQIHLKICVLFFFFLKCLLIFFGGVGR